MVLEQERQNPDATGAVGSSHCCRVRARLDPGGVHLHILSARVHGMKRRRHSGDKSLVPCGLRRGLRSWRSAEKWPAAAGADGHCPAGLRPCLVHIEIQKIFKISRHIES